jgi:hypothetical protein
MSIRTVQIANFVFACPTTGFDVQHELDDDPDISDNEYEAITLPAPRCISSIERPAGY